MSILIMFAGIDPWSVGLKGHYLAEYDADRNGAQGHIVWTPDIAKAKRFAHFTEALCEWQRTSTTMPLRADGQANRPLSAFSITFEETPS